MLIYVQVGYLLLSNTIAYLHNKVKDNLPHDGQVANQIELVEKMGVQSAQIH